jgi:hypothetical protein
MKTKTIFITIVLITFQFLITSCHNNSNDIQSKEAEKAIKDYLERTFEYIKPEGINIATFKVLGTDEKNDTIVYYVWAYIIDYTNESNKLEENRGSSLPVKLYLLNKNNIYTVVKAEKPLDGDQYDNSMKKLFPKDVYKQASSFGNEEVDKLKKQSVKEAEEHFARI